MLDLRHAVRGLLRTPGFTLVTILSLAIAIGANGAIFSLIDGLWFRPPGVRDPGSLVRIFATTEQEREDAFSFPEYRELRDRTSTFAGVVARGRRGALLNSPGEVPDILLVNVVSTNFFSVLGVNAVAGRVFAPGDEAALEQQPSVVFGHAFWKRRFGGDPSIVGKTITLGRETPLPVVVIGILPESFRDLDPATDRDLWMPPQTWVRLTNRAEFEQRDYRWFELMARLQPGAPVSRANAEVATVAQGFSDSYPSTNRGRGARAIADLHYRLDSGGVSAMALIGVVVFVALITCVNVANLLLARAATRVREIALRLALGATRWRIVRQLFAESVLLGAAGAAGGVVVALWLIGILPAVIVQPPGFPSFLIFAADHRMILATLAVSLTTTVIFGLIPGWAGSRVDLVPIMKGEVALPVASRGQRRMRGVLVTLQIAVSLALLCSAAALGKSFLQTRHADIGFERKPVLTAWCTFAEIPQATEADAVSRLRALPGVSDVAIAFRAPLSLSGGGLSNGVTVPGTRADLPVQVVQTSKYNAVTPNYFRVMGTRIIRGRAFEYNERTAKIAIVNQQFASRFFPGADALGQVFNERRIVGIAQNAAINQIGEEPEPYFYVPFPDRLGEMTFLIAAERDAGALSGPVRETLRAVDDRLTPRRLVTMQQLTDYSARDYRMTAALVSALGAIGLLLTAMGVYGVVAYNTMQRLRELGIRSAIGATRAELMRVILADGARLTLLGLAGGLPLALVSTRLLSSFLFDTAPWEATTFILAAIAVVVAMGVASLVPAWRGSRMNVIEALR